MKEVYTTIPVYGNEVKPSLDISNENHQDIQFDSRILDPRTVQNFEISKNNALDSNNGVLNKIAESMGLEELPKAINDYNNNPNPERREIITEILAENGKYIESEVENSLEKDMQVSRKMDFRK